MLPKLVRITTVPISLEKLLEGQLTFMNKYYEVIAVSSEKQDLEKFGHKAEVRSYAVEMTRRITPFRDLKALITLYRFLKREKPLIVHTHTPKAGTIGMMAAKMAGVPVRLHTVAGMPLMVTSGIKRKVLEKVEQLTYSFATKVYPNSEGLQKIIIDANLAQPEKLKVLGEGGSNGIDIKYFDPAKFSLENIEKIKRSLGIPAGDVVFIFVGRLVKDKGINELVQAFVNLISNYEQITLLLVGSFEQELDPISEENRRLILEHQKIIATGYQVDVRPYFAIADVLVFPSYREGFPNVVMQAGAMGLPSIVTDINGCNEIIINQRNGVVIPPQNADALLRAMKELVEIPSLRERLSKESRRLICSRFERKQFWQILLKEYKSLEKDSFKD